MASLSAAHQSQHTATAHRHFHSDPFGLAIRLQLGHSAALSGVGPSPAPLFPSLAPAIGAASVGSSASSHQNLLLNHFLLSSAPSTSSSLNPFTRWSFRQPYHSQSPQLMLDGRTQLSVQFPSAETFADSSQPQSKELVDQHPQQQQQQQSSVCSDVSSFSFSSAGSAADSDGRSCSSGSFAGTQPQNGHQLSASVEQNGQLLQKPQSAAAQQQQQQIEPKTHQQKPKKLLVRDEAYWERRRKNNDAAKRSRDSRRKKEDEVTIRAVVLEQENLQLRFEVERLRTEIERHRIVAFGETMAAVTAENAVDVAVSKMPISSSAMAQLTTVATAMGMANPILNP